MAAAVQRQISDASELHINRKQTLPMKTCQHFVTFDAFEKLLLATHILYFEVCLFSS
jgi:hypothetical protein